MKAFCFVQTVQRFRGFSSTLQGLYFDNHYIRLNKYFLLVYLRLCVPNTILVIMIHATIIILDAGIRKSQVEMKNSYFDLIYIALRGQNSITMLS